jgi:hypothetical protein
MDCSLKPYGVQPDRGPIPASAFRQGIGLGQGADAKRDQRYGDRENGEIQGSTHRSALDFPLQFTSDLSVPQLSVSQD